MGYYYYDATYLLVLIGFALCAAASGYVKNAMNRYSKVRNTRGITGAEAAELILHREGIYDVTIECLEGESGDHFDPSSKAVRLSRSNFYGTSVTAVGVAAHECGHAIQHDKGYAPLTFRTALLPVANLGSKLGVPMILIGFFLGALIGTNISILFIEIGIVAYALAVLFQVVTLPVEFNASKRALVKIEDYGILTSEENQGAKKVLRAAALTYVAAAASAILQLIRLVLISNNRRSRR